MTDRELLELAAKAAGYVIQEYRADVSAWVYPVGEIPDEDGDYDGLFLWRPCADDGDALRLAIKLRMAVDVNVCFVDVAWCNYVLSEMYDLQEDWGDGDVGCEVKIAATRRAIVRAAAEIGRAMP